MAIKMHAITVSRHYFMKANYQVAYCTIGYRKDGTPYWTNVRLHAWSPTFKRAMRVGKRLAKYLSLPLVEHAIRGHDLTSDQRIVMVNCGLLAHQYLNM